MRQPINIIFDGPPSHVAGRFVEVETDDGASICAGEWVERIDGTWALRITALPEKETTVEDKWVTEPCDQDRCDEGSHLCPRMGDWAMVEQTMQINQPITETIRHWVTPGEIGRVVDFRPHEVCVDFGDGRIGWVNVDLLVPPDREFDKDDAPAVAA